MTESNQHLYKTPPPPEDHITTLRNTPNPPEIPHKPSYGIDSPAGLIYSSILAPLYLYSSLKGKFDLWDELLSTLTDEELRQPTLDIGCGRGMVLLKVAQRKKTLQEQQPDTTTYTTDTAAASPAVTAKAYGIDLFISSDQSGNKPEATYVNAAALEVLDQTVLHSADFADLPFAEGVFSVVTASLSIHNAGSVHRGKAVREVCRVVRPGGLVLIVDLLGFVGGYEATLKAEGWQDVRREMGGLKVMFGSWPCQILKARKPIGI